MVDWLERAKRKFAQSADPVTANTAERNPTAVTAVPDPGDAEILRASIGSNGSATATDFQETEASDDDDRRACTQCANLTGRGLCLAARRGEIVASRSYEPIRDLPRRCEGYMPGGDDTDRRPGQERWPGLIWKGNDDANQ
jgi:hypothetical protein